MQMMLLLWMNFWPIILSGIAPLIHWLDNKPWYTGNVYKHWVFTQFCTIFFHEYRCEKFSFISLHHSVFRGGSDVNIIHGALDLTVQPQQISNLGHPGPSPHWTSDMGPTATSKQHQTWDHSLLVTSVDDHWLLVQLCSFGGHWNRSTYIWSPSKWYVSYWNAFLFWNILCICTKISLQNKIHCQRAWAS